MILGYLFLKIEKICKKKCIYHFLSKLYRSGAIKAWKWAKKLKMLDLAICMVLQHFLRVSKKSEKIQGHSWDAQEGVYSIFYRRYRYSDTQPLHLPPPSSPPRSTNHSTSSHITVSTTLHFLRYNSIKIHVILKCHLLHCPSTVGYTNPPPTL